MWTPNKTQYSEHCAFYLTSLLTHAQIKHFDDSVQMYVQYLCCFWDKSTYYGCRLLVVSAACTCCTLLYGKDTHHAHVSVDDWHCDGTAVQTSKDHDILTANTLLSNQNSRCEQVKHAWQVCRRTCCRRWVCKQAVVERKTSDYHFVLVATVLYFLYEVEKQHNIPSKFTIKEFLKFSLDSKQTSTKFWRESARALAEVALPEV